MLRAQRTVRNEADKMLFSLGRSAESFVVSHSELFTHCKACWLALKVVHLNPFTDCKFTRIHSLTEGVLLLLFVCFVLFYSDSFIRCNTRSLGSIHRT